MYSTASNPTGKVYGKISNPDGTAINLGRIDNKYWAPRLWWYKYVIFPQRKKKQYGNRIHERG